MIHYLLAFGDLLTTLVLATFALIGAKTAVEQLRDHDFKFGVINGALAGILLFGLVRTSSQVLNQLAVLPG